MACAADGINDSSYLYIRCILGCEGQNYFVLYVLLYMFVENTS